QRADGTDAPGQPVDHADPQGVPVLVGHPARQRRTRHVRVLRRAHSSAARVRPGPACSALTRAGCASPPAGMGIPRSMNERTANGSTDSRHARPPGVGDDTVEAAGKMSEALEYIERARGHLYTFHQLIGHADALLD